MLNANPEDKAAGCDASEVMESGLWFSQCFQSHVTCGKRLYMGVTFNGGLQPIGFNWFWHVLVVAAPPRVFGREGLGAALKRFTQGYRLKNQT